MLCLLLSAADPSEVALLQHGLAALRQGQLQQAKVDLEQVSAKDPDNPYAWTSLAETYLRLKDTAKASEAAKAAERAGANNPVISHALAMYYSESGDMAKAAAFEEAFANSPKADAGALGRAAALYLNAGDANRALPLAEQATAKNESADNEDVLGRALLGAGRAQDAVAHLQTAWKLDNNNPRIAFDYAQLLLQQQNFTQAAEVLEPAAAANPRDPQLMLALGVCRYGQRRFDDAIAAFLKVIQLDPNAEQPYSFLGRVLDQAGSRLPEIKEAFEQHATRAPGDAQAQLLLAKVLLVSNPTDSRAEMLLRQSISADTNDSEAHYQLGVLLANKHDYAAAAAELKRSIELKSAEPAAHYHLARVYDRLGQHDLAKSEREIHRQLLGQAVQ